MTTTLLIKRETSDSYQWCRWGDNTGDAGDANALVAACANSESVVLLAAAEDVSLRLRPFAKQERKMLAKTMPYSLEDDVAEDIDDLHIALGSPIDSAEGDQTDGHVAVAVINRDQLTEWLAELTALGITVQAVVPELLLLPWQPDSWTLLAQDGRCLLRYGRYTGFAFEDAVAGLALQLLMEQEQPLSADNAITVKLYGEPSQQKVMRALLPEPLRTHSESHDADYWSLLAGRAADDTSDAGDDLSKPPLNLLQGAFARSWPWRTWWRQWRLVAATLLIVVAAQWSLNYTEWRMLEKDNADLRQQTEQAYRTAIPAGQIIDPKRQLQRQVNNMKGKRSDGFVSLFAKIALPLAETEGLTLQSLNYAENQSEIRLSIVVPNFNAVEELRLRIEQQGLNAEMTGSNAEGDRTRARLRIRG